MREQIEKVIRELLSPLFAKEGGTIELVDVRDDVVRLRLSGAYRGCPSSSFMVSGFVLPAFRQAVGRDVRVEVLA
jgi:Fe-S cluster biogenesis protein NfuA